MPRVRREFERKRFAYFAPKLYNELSSSVTGQGVSETTYKENIYKYLMYNTRSIDIMLGLRTLDVRCKAQDILFLYRILNGLVDCPEILGSINLRVPSNTKSQDLFGRLHHATNYEMKSAIYRMHRLGNLVDGDVDFFHGIASFKRTSLAILQQRYPP
ncbi:hypothetical protein J6590_053903 [Homalodisca vitripennis]|nr:hypothetical protein J6590_053903 [Homalodisca vitripennis]